MNHFLPKEFIFACENSEYLAFIFLEIIRYKFTDEKYQFNDKSVNEYNNIMRKLFFMLKKHNLNIKNAKLEIKQNKQNIYIYKKTELANILIPDNIDINNKQLFKQYVDKSISEFNKENIKTTLNNYMKTIINENRNERTPMYQYSIRSVNIGHYLQKSTDNINNYFKNNLFYIGPLREEPRLQYEGYIENIQNIGIKGENSAGILYQNQKKLTRYISTIYFEQNKYIKETDYCYLSDSTNEWLRYIGIADSVSVNFKGRYGYELKIKTIDKKKDNDLTNVGVGVSQVLPIILVCLLAPEEATIIIEQPELHLHPAMQTKLTDFFVATILCNKQLIIETHSEYIINRLRLRAINLQTEKSINDSVKIYFTENLKEDYKNYKKGNTLFRPININEYGAISDWPEGFFDESSENADEIYNAASLKWKQKQEINND